jgi:hypothetical protein
VYLLNFSQYLVPQSTWNEEHSMIAMANTSHFLTSFSLEYVQQAVYVCDI